MDIIKSKRFMWALVGSALAVILASGIILVSLEYRYFKHQAEHMIELQTQYKNYLLLVKKVMREYESTQTENASEEASSDEKKNNEDDEGAFIVVRRGAAHNKEVTLSYMKERQLVDVFYRIPSENWIEYTDQALMKPGSKSGDKRPVKDRKRTLKARVKKGRVLIPVKRLRFEPRERIFAWPIDSACFWISSLFGRRRLPNGFHYGIDMASVRGTLVHAAGPGRVVIAQEERAYGKTVVIVHNNQYKTRYAHLDKILVSVGQQVDRGTMIGRVGSTGRIVKSGYDGSHLHFEVSSFGQRINPLYVLGA